MAKKKTVEDYRAVISKNQEKIEKLNDQMHDLHIKNQTLHEKIAEIKRKENVHQVYKLGVKNYKKGSEYKLIDVIKFVEDNQPIFTFEGSYEVGRYAIYKMPNGTLFNVWGDCKTYVNAQQTYWNGEYFENYDESSQAWEGWPYEVDYDYFDDDFDESDECNEEIMNFIKGMNKVAAEIALDKEIEKELSR